MGFSALFCANYCAIRRMNGAKGEIGLNPDLKSALMQECPGLSLREREPMGKHTSFRLGGPAALMVFPKTQSELAAVLRVSQRLHTTPVILGAGTNVLAPDEGLDALVVCTKDCLCGMRRIDETRIEVYAGETMARAAVFARGQGLSGLEFAHGIPGTVGGGLFMNAGAYAGEISQVADRTTVVYPDGTERVFADGEQRFSYRSSVFQKENCVIVKTVFRLTPGNRETIRTRMRELADRRRTSQPLDLPSAGSTFKRPACGYAAALIEHAGLKGLTVGGASVSAKHAGFVVNLGGATCADVLRLIEEIQKRVYADSGIRLEPEVRIL